MGNGHSTHRLQDAVRADGEAPAASADTLNHIAAAWTHVGAYFSIPPADGPLDLEGLIADTACVVPDDERLFVVAVSWLAVHHGFVNGPRLEVLAAELAGGEESAEASAALGALLSWAYELSGGAAESLRAAITRCRPVSPQRPFFRIVREMPMLAKRVRRDALPRFAAWGFWHDGDAAKPEAVRPAAWIVAHAPELRFRALARATPAG